MHRPQTDQIVNPYEEQITLVNSLHNQLGADIRAIDEQGAETPLAEFVVIKQKLLEAQMYAQRIVEKANEEGVTRENAERTG